MRQHTRTKYKTDLAILTAVDVEYEQLRRAFPELCNHGSEARCVSGIVDGLTVIACQQHQMGMPAAAATAMQMIHEHRPRYVAMTGITAGIKGKTELGTIVVADPSFDYGSGKIVAGTDEAQSGSGPTAPSTVGGQTVKTSEPRFELEIRQERLAHLLLDVVHRLEQDDQLLSKIHDEFMSASGLPHPGNPPRVVVGPVASGAAVVADRELVERIRARQERKLVGIEMEVYGMMYAARFCSVPQPRAAVAVKAVSVCPTRGGNG
ncbi:MAG: hypothetical protein ACLQVD_13490 [Capsulimonadaceae bacterium]